MEMGECVCIECFLIHIAKLRFSIDCFYIMFSVECSL